MVKSQPEHRPLLSKMTIRVIPLPLVDGVSHPVPLYNAPVKLRWRYHPDLTPLPFTMTGPPDGQVTARAPPAAEQEDHPPQEHWRLALLPV
jgi:hypothetical protein